MIRLGIGYSLSFDPVLVARRSWHHDGRFDTVSILAKPRNVKVYDDVGFELMRDSIHHYGLSLCMSMAHLDPEEKLHQALYFP